jgi:transposase
MARKQAAGVEPVRRRKPRRRTPGVRLGRPPVLDAIQKQWVLQRLQAQPQQSLPQLGQQVHARFGVHVSESTLARFLHSQGIHKPRRQEGPFKRPVATRRYGYSAQHRDSTQRRYPSSLTDAEWALIEDLFEHRGAGRKARYDRRQMVDAICYVVRSGCPWRMLPREFPPWQNVYATFRRWAQQGLWEAMHDRLRAMWRQRVGRDAQPTAGVLDSQSVPTAEKGGLEVLTGPSV